MENKRYEPMVAATYPAAMAGLCLTSLAIISSKFYVSKEIVFMLSAASLAFITSCRVERLSHNYPTTTDSIPLSQKYLVLTPVPFSICPTQKCEFISK